jgi:hypothetical protein
VRREGNVMRAVQRCKPFPARPDPDRLRSQVAVVAVIGFTPSLPSPFREIAIVWSGTNRHIARRVHNRKGSLHQQRDMVGASGLWVTSVASHLGHPVNFHDNGG